MKLIRSSGLIAAISLFSMFFILPMSAHAATDSLNTAITWDGNCNDSIYDNGSTTAYAYYASGDTVNLTVNNNSSVALEIGIKGQSPTPVRLDRLTSYHVHRQAARFLQLKRASGRESVESPPPCCLCSG